MANSLGLILANRAVVLGAIKARDLVDITVQAERSRVFDAVWVGDSLLAKPRLESVTLLSALASVTERVRLAVGCMATFVHRHPVMLAHQWASLDVLSNGRAWLAVCLGGLLEGGGFLLEVAELFGVDRACRRTEQAGPQQEDAGYPEGGWRSEHDPSPFRGGASSQGC